METENTDKSVENPIATCFFHVVICTYNRCKLLEQTLESLSSQTMNQDGSWAVLVVDNNCTDDTRLTISKYNNKLPRLQVISETRQGLTEARQCGVKNAVSNWIAFVDDDCILESDWVQNAIAFCKTHPDVAAFNGHNTLVFEGGAMPPWVHPGMFAAVNPGSDQAKKVKGPLHGAGMVLRRTSVIRSRWLDRPLAADRRGNSLVSGGDNELSSRAQAGGGELWFVPQCDLKHYVQSDRLKLTYLTRLNYRLAEAGPLSILMRSRKNKITWHRNMLGHTLNYILRALSLKRDDLSRTDSGWRGKVLSISRAFGFTVGYFKLLISPRSVSRIQGVASPEWVDQNSL